MRRILSVIAVMAMSFQLFSLSAQSADIKYPYRWKTKTNPVVDHVFACDPSAKVFSDSTTVWVIASHDQDDARGFFMMRDYHLFSTQDMKNWTDYGSVMSADDVSWAKSHMWAPDICERDGKYYIYAPCNFRIGVFVSDRPEGPYKDAIGKPLVPFTECIDPMVFIDDDGQAYLYFSRRGTNCYVVKLKDNMIEMDGDIVELTNKSLNSTVNGDFCFVEGPYLHKRGDKYYLSYPAKEYLHGGDRNYTGDEMICYAVSDNPMGPFEYGGRITDGAGIHTIHGSIIHFKGEDYLFYHNGARAKAGSEDDQKNTRHRRSMCMQKLTYAEDGSINFVEQTEKIF